MSAGSVTAVETAAPPAGALTIVLDAVLSQNNVVPLMASKVGPICAVAIDVGATVAAAVVRLPLAGPWGLSGPDRVLASSKRCMIPPPTTAGHPRRGCALQRPAFA